MVSPVAATAAEILFFADLRNSNGTSGSSCPVLVGENLPRRWGAAEPCARGVNAYQRRTVSPSLPQFFVGCGTLYCLDA